MLPFSRFFLYHCLKNPQSLPFTELCIILKEDIVFYVGFTRKTIESSLSLLRVSYCFHTAQCRKCAVKLKKIATTTDLFYIFVNFDF